MKRYMIWLLLLTVLPLAASAQTDLIAAHEAWVDKHYSSPDTMSGQDLLRECRQVICYNMQEEKSLALLRTASCQVPQLEEYLAWQKRGVVDTLHRHTLAALQGIADYADRTWPGTYFAADCRADYLMCAGNIRDTWDDWTRLIEEYGRSVTPMTPANERALLPRMKAMAVIQRNVRRHYDDPAEYQQVFDIEKEGLSIYPPQSSEVNMERAHLYRWLGELKNSMTDEFVAAALQSEATYNAGTTFDITGPKRMYPNNAGYYFNRAAEMSASLIGQGHPLTREMARSALHFHCNNYYIGPEILQKLREDFEYMRRYYPSASLELAQSRILWCLICLQNGEPTTDDLFLWSDCDTMEAALGKSNPIFLQNLVQTGGTMAFLFPEKEEWTERMDKAVEESGLGEDLDVLMYFITLMQQQLYMSNPTEAKGVLEEVRQEYMKDPKPKPISVLTGLALADFYTNTLHDKEHGALLHAFAAHDRQTLAGTEYYNKPEWWEVICGSSDYLDGVDDKDKLKTLISWLEMFDIVSFPGSNYIQYRFNKEIAEIYANRLHDYKNALKYARAALEKLPAGMTDARIQTLCDMAILLQRLGRKQSESMPYIEQAAGLYMSVDGRGISTLSFAGIADYYYNEGMMENALEWSERQLSAYEQQFGKDTFSVEYLNLRRCLADCYSQLGNLTKVSEIYSEDADRISKAYGVTPSPPMLECLWQDYFNACNENTGDMIILPAKLDNISRMTLQMIQLAGNNQELSDKYVGRMMAASVSLMSPQYDIYVAEGANLVGEMKEQFDRVVSALPQAVENLEQIKESYKKRDPDYLRNTDYYYISAALGAYYKYVKKDIARAIEIDKEFTTVGVNDQNHVVFSSIAENYEYLGDMDNARQYVDKIEKAIPDLKLSTGDILYSIESFRIRDAIRTGKYAQALPYIRSFFKRHKEELDGNFQFMSTADQEGYMAFNGDPAQSYAAMLEYMPQELAAEAYDAVVYRTGMQLRSQQATKRAIEKSDDPAVRVMLDSVNTLRTILLNMGSNPTVSTEEMNKKITLKAELMRKIKRMEQKLLAATRHLREGSISDVSWQQIRDRLGKDQAAVEYVFSNEHVMALVVRPGYDVPHAVMLERGDTLFSSIQGPGYRNSASRAKALYTAQGNTLYHMLWQPIEQELKGVKTVYYAAPGILSNLAFNAFAADDGAPLFDRYNLVQLTTTAQLVFDSNAAAPKTIAMMGDILYDEKQQPLSPDSPGARAVDDEFDFEDEGDDSSRALNKTHFRHLPFTQAEIDEIAGMFPQENVDSVRRLNATELRLRQMVIRHPDVLHLATHGYYISPDRDIRRYPFLMAKGGGNMQRSGIALAGAEKTWCGRSDAADESDGILTAAEVAELDLNGTQLVSLSACETALGDFNFEGIFGLQRGFKQAGVQSMLVSLWSVNDRSTALFMRTFYTSLQSGRTRYESWRDAVTAVRTQFPEPYHWASFIILDAR